ncbi:MAG: acyl-CoA reductase-like NAD-dependent aldehyde dehydrogenase [Cognaticolwellia sp.]|jgi:acyl-CoA reductase-like NAD-dependent aldehyde dehydrogenase
MTTSYKVNNPFNNNLLGEFHFSTKEELQTQLNLLKEGQTTLKHIPAHERSDILRRLAELLEDNAEKFAKLITLETGKTISDSRIEMTRAVNAAVASSEEARQITGESLDSDAYAPTRGKIGIVCWRPLGTVLCITPFNFPINIALHKIGPAFAAGNSVMFKPGPQNTLSSKLLTELCYQAGFPTNTLQLCMPDIPEMGGLIADPLVNVINFTGGTAAANSIANAAGYKKLLLELGGNDPLIVMADGDIDSAVNAAVNQRFATAGQRCTAAKRIFLHEDIYTQFRDTLVTKTEQLIIGNPLQEDTFIGPIINEKAANDVKQSIEQAISAGATVALGNKQVGNIIYPTILENVNMACELMVEETFGPVIPLMSFSDIEDIIPLINNSAYGLQGGIFTQQLDLIKYLFEELDIGTLAVNDGPGFRAEHFPFGGVKASGVGREGIKYAIREMSYLKTLVI